MLRERINQLERALSGSELPPIQLGLTSREAAVFGVLLQRTFATKDVIMAALYRDFGRDEAEPKIVDVFVCKIRRKIKAFGIEIRTRWGQGYEMPPESKALVRQMMGNAKAEAA